MPLPEQSFREALDALWSPRDVIAPQGRGPSVGEFLHVRKFAAGPNIVGLGIGDRITAGRELSELSLKVYVVKKLQRKKVDAGELIPTEVVIPSAGRPIPTDVVEIGRQTPQRFTTKVRPLKPGYCLGSVRSQGGTFGCLVHKKGAKKTLYLLSNSHVLAFCGKGKKGDAILQPDRFDGGRKADLVATLKDWVPFKLGSRAENYCDAAIALPSDTIELSSEIAMIGIPKGVNLKPKRGMKIQKTGAATGHTFGVIKDINYRTNLAYARTDGLDASVRYTDQVLCTRYSDGGDSGSAVCDMQRRVVGLHFAGSASSSVFSPIARVLDALGVQLVTWAV